MLKFYWDSLPIGKENAVDYETLCEQWKMNKRKVRQTLHDLSLYDSGDNYILIRSSSGKGFFRTDDMQTIKAFRNECLNKAKSNFAPLKKINRLISEADDKQYDFFNNLKSVRIEKGLKQRDVVAQIQKYDKSIDEALLSKFENSVCIPTPYQLFLLAQILGCKPVELIDTELLYCIA